jgi:F0F1-type ATP synthase assembly protein I
MQLVFALAALGMELLLPTLVGGALDYYFGWAPWGVLIGAGLGLTIVLLHAIRRGNLDDQSPTRHRANPTSFIEEQDPRS